jgi:hypothetical protein
MVLATAISEICSIREGSMAERCVRMRLAWPNQASLNLQHSAAFFECRAQDRGQPDIKLSSRTSLTWHLRTKQYDNPVALLLLGAHAGRWARRDMLALLGKMRLRALDLGCQKCILYPAVRVSWGMGAKLCTFPLVESLYICI